MGKHTPSANRVDWAAPKFKGKTFAFAGRFYPSDSDQDELVRVIKAEGGKVVEAVTETLDFLIVGRTRGGQPSAAQKKAAHLNQKKGAAIQIMTESDVYDLLSPSRDEALAMLQAGEEGVDRWRQLRQRTWAPLDLSGIDLHGAGLTHTNFQGVNLDGADLRNADLSYASLGGFQNARLDGARLVLASVRKFVDCSVRHADLTWVHLNPGVIERSDFTGAKLADAVAAFTVTTGAVFRDTDLWKAGFEGSKFAGADFTGANLEEARLGGCDLGGATLTRARLSRADLSEANLARADLRKADLRQANLVDADLTDARIDGANFEGANLVGARLGGLDPKKAKGLDPARASAGGRVGPDLRELDRVAGQARRLETAAVMELPDGTVPLRVTSYRNCQCVSTYLGSPRMGYCGQARSPSAAMVDLARKCGNGTLRLDSITANSSKSPVSGKELKDLAVRAWCEACGVPAPTADARREQMKVLKAGRQELREQMVADLRGGAVGVARWNARTPEERRSAGHFRRVDLAGAKLRGVHLGGSYQGIEGTEWYRPDFQGGVFDGADLREADLSGGNFREASFKGANLRGASLGGASLGRASFEGASLAGCNLRGIMSFRRVNCQGANLRKGDFAWSDLRGADLSSADLTGARFEHTRYDEHTRFPPGFQPREGLEWAGSAPAPATCMRAEDPAGPLDFDAFLARLRQHTDPAKLAKALKMLQAERFQLFSSVDTDRVVGVVKSQTDPDLVYSCALSADGSYGCCTQNLNVCGGLRGAPCKHLLVLVLGLTRGGVLDAAKVDAWVQASRARRPELDRDAMSETLLRYKGAEAGEVDWRPTETVPEDYYSL